MGVIGLILGGRSIFAGLFPSPLGKDQCVMVKSWKAIQCLGAVAHLSYDPSSIPQQFS